MENELTKSPLTDEEARKVTGGGMKNPWESMEESKLADEKLAAAAGGGRGAASKLVCPCGYEEDWTGVSAKNCPVCGQPMETRRKFNFI